MANSGWTKDESPFHPGERAIQARLGVQAQMERQGQRVIRDYFPQQHQQFYSRLPYVIVGSVDVTGSPWASILVGKPGFLSTPDDRTLRVATQPLFGDPLAHNLAIGHPLGFLGIELHTRRRNRMSGTIVAIHPDSFSVQVRQTFGNCPQYIQARKFEDNNPDLGLQKKVHHFDKLSAAEKSMIAVADTLFIATAYESEAAGLASGVDVSHRGGNPGFVRIDDPTTLTIPDFSGNHHFNTFGNLELNPQAGLLFLDFVQGNLLYLTGRAEVIWSGPEVALYTGAERLLRFHLSHGYRVEESLPLRWSEPEFSPYLDPMGSWT